MNSATTMAIRIHRHGSPETMLWEEIPLAPPGPGEVRVRHTAIGVNFSDINVRRGGFYPNHAPPLPLGLGNEAAGVVEAVGEQVDDLRIGDRVAYAGMLGQFYEDTGAYALARNVPAERLVGIPDGVTDRHAAAILLKGCTASLIVNRLHTPKPGEIVLVHTAAAGVGSLLCQWSRHLGATVIGTVGSREKAELARRNGCHHVVLYRETDFAAEVRRLAPEGVSVVFDGVGKDTFLPSLELLRPFGKAVNFGNASGNVPPFNVMALAIKSLSIARAGVTGHIQDRAAFRKEAGALFDLVRRGVLSAHVHRTYALKDAADAHRDIEASSVAGSVVLLP